MKKFIVGLIVVVGCVGAISVLRRGTKEPEAAPASRRIAVSVMPVVASNIETYVAATGNAEAFEDILVSAQIAEKILAITVNESDVVTAGQVIAELDVRESRAALEATSRTVDQLESSVLEATETLSNETRTFTRSESLFKQKIASQQVYDDTQSKVKIAVAKKGFAAAVLNQARAKEREQAVRVERCIVRAPFDGIIAERRLDPGAYVLPGTPIVRLANVHPLIVKVQLPETVGGTVRLGCPARVTLSANQTVDLTGTVMRVHPVVDAAWRTQTIEIACPNDHAAAQPGMFARVKIVTGNEQALLVPDVAVMRLPGSGITHLYVARTGTAVRVDVAVTGHLGAYLGVRGMLEPGMDVVVKGQQRLQTGMPIEPVRTEMLP